MIFSKETLYNLKRKPTNFGERGNFDLQCYNIVRPRNLVSNNNNKTNNENNHKAHKEIGKYFPFEEQNKSTETMPEEDQMLTMALKQLSQRYSKSRKKALTKTESLCMNKMRLCVKR